MTIEPVAIDERDAELGIHITLTAGPEAAGRERVAEDRDGDWRLGPDELRAAESRWQDRAPALFRVSLDGSLLRLRFAARIDVGDDPTVGTVPWGVTLDARAPMVVGPHRVRVEQGSMPAGVAETEIAIDLSPSWRLDAGWSGERPPGVPSSPAPSLFRFAGSPAVAKPDAANAADTADAANTTGAANAADTTHAEDTTHVADTTLVADRSATFDFTPAAERGLAPPPDRDARRSRPRTPTSGTLIAAALALGIIHARAARAGDPRAPSRAFIPGCLATAAHAVFPAVAGALLAFARARLWPNPSAMARAGAIAAAGVCVIVGSRSRAEIGLGHDEHDPLAAVIPASTAIALTVAAAFTCVAAALAAACLYLLPQALGPRRSSAARSRDLRSAVVAPDGAAGAVPGQPSGPPPDGVPGVLPTPSASTVTAARATVGRVVAAVLAVVVALLALAATIAAA